MVLAGGFGTRLKSITNHIPKVLVDVCGAPFLKYQIENWKKLGINSFIFLLHYQSELIIRFLKSEENNLFKNCKLSWVVEDEPFGTGGSISNAVDCLGLENEFLLINGDTWIDADISSMVNLTAPSLGLIWMDDCGRYGNVLMNNENEIISFAEKTNKRHPGWIYSGVSYLSCASISTYSGGKFSLENDYFPELIKGHSVPGIEFYGNFIDIGIPSDYYRFCRWIEAAGEGIL